MNTDHSFEQLCKLLSVESQPQDFDSTKTLNWNAILNQSARHRVQPLLLNAIKTKGIEAPQSILAHLKQEQRTNAMNGLKIDRAAVLIHSLFNQNGINICFFKGTTLESLIPNQFTFRHAGDLDILLIDSKQVVEADTLLTGYGLERLGFSSLTQMNNNQLDLLRKYEKDLRYFWPEIGIVVELHFRLFVNEKLLPLSNLDIYSNCVLASLGGQKLPIMSLQHHQIYLLLHGATSIWFRLKWICDIPAISDQGKYYQSSEFGNIAKDFGIERMATQGIILASTLLQMPARKEIKQKHQKSRVSQYLVACADDHLQRVIPSKLTGVPKVKYWLFYVAVYLPLLKPGLRHKLRSISSYGTRKTDWELVALPRSLSWIYFVFRPVFWIYRQIQLKKH
jgi:hypothetical protein